MLVIPQTVSTLRMPVSTVRVSKWFTEHMPVIQKNPSIMDTIGDQHFVCYGEVRVPNSGTSGIFPVGVVLRNPAVEYNVAAFSKLSFAA